MLHIVDEKKNQYLTWPEMRSTDFAVKPMSLILVAPEVKSIVFSLEQAALAMARIAEDRRIEETSFMSSTDESFCEIFQQN